jgi:hypothetical protein
MLSINNLCQVKDCKNKSIFNYPNKTTECYCKSHKLDGMINVINNKVCIENGCHKYSTYNYEGEKNPLYCFTHKHPKMINIVSKRCKFVNCNKIPIYNFKGVKVGIYCNEHKLENMINVKDSICTFDNCNTRANYNIKGMKKGIYCNIHKSSDMVDVRNKKCIFENCITRPSYNYYNINQPIYCNKHKLKDMVNVNDNKCMFKECTTIAIFNYENKTKPLYCSKHKEIGMIDIRSRMCLTPLCNTRVHNSRYDGYCLRCFVYLFPDKPNTHNYKTKEKSVTDFITSQFKDLTIIIDKKIQDGCSKRRPDLLIDLGYQILIIEIDENQHSDYDCTCENKRLMEISHDLLYRPIVLIRFNPDSYINSENINITSCWSIDKRGICCIKKSKLKEWNIRLNILKEHINYWIDNKTNKTIEVIQLFYNQHNL